MNIVSVNIPKLKFDSVIFSWHSSKKVSFFKKNSFYIKYKDVNIEKIPIEYLLHAFLSIMIPIYTYCDEDVLFKFPIPVPTKIAELWINYHNAKNIHIEPLSNVEYDVFKASNDLDTKVGILFGGGKDSTFALSVLNEIYGPKNIVIMSYVLPYMDNIMEKH